MNKQPIRPDFNNPDSLEKDMVDTMENYEMRMPVPLNQADLSLPFVYDRRYGVFHVGMGYHVFAMATILAWDRGHYDWYDVDIPNLPFAVEHCSDYYLENTKGTAFKSSLSVKSGAEVVYAGKKGNLNSLELDYFENLWYICNE